MLRFLVELLAGVLAACLVTLGAMAALFTFAGLANPPGMNELFAVLLMAAVVVSAARWRRRSRASGEAPMPPQPATLARRRWAWPAACAVAGVLAGATAVLLMVRTAEHGGLFGLNNSWWFLALAVLLLGAATRQVVTTR